MTGVPQVDIVDDSFVVGAQAVVAARLRDPGFWRTCWPDVHLKAYHDRGVEGLRWYASGMLIGTAELWLEPYRDGTLVHVFLRADPARRLSARMIDRLRRRCATSLKVALFDLKDDVEAGRPVGSGTFGAGPAGPAGPAASGHWARRAARLTHCRSEPSRTGIETMLDELADSGERPRLIDVERMKGGIATATHRLTVRTGRGSTRDVALKRYLPDDETARYEWERLGLARRSAVPTPEPLLLDLEGRWFGTPALLMAALPGETSHDRDDNEGWVAQLAGTLAAIHRTRLLTPIPDVVRRPATWATFEADELPPGVRAEAIRSALAHLRQLAKTQPVVFSHGDYHPGNVLFDGGVISGVVDWSATKLEPAGFDVATCRAMLAVMSGAELPDRFLAAYRNAAEAPVVHLRLWDVLAGARAFQWSPHAQEAFAALGVRIEADEVRKRIEVFLDEALDTGETSAAPIAGSSPRRGV